MGANVQLNVSSTAAELKFSSRCFQKSHVAIKLEFLQIPHLKKRRKKNCTVTSVSCAWLMFYIRRDTKAERKSSSSAPVAAVSSVSFINHCPGFGETIYMRCYSARRCPTNTLTFGILCSPQVSLCWTRRTVSWFYLRTTQAPRFLRCHLIQWLDPVAGRATVPTFVSFAMSTFENSCFVALLPFCIPRMSVYTINRQADMHAQRRTHFWNCPQNQMY